MDLWAFKGLKWGSPEEDQGSRLKTFSDATTAKFHRGQRQDPSRSGLGWAGLGWAGLGWAGLGWAGLGWISGQLASQRDVRI